MKKFSKRHGFEEENNGRKSNWGIFLGYYRKLSLSLSMIIFLLALGKESAFDSSNLVLFFCVTDLQLDIGLFRVRSGSLQTATQTIFLRFGLVCGFKIVVWVMISNKPWFAVWVGF